MNIAATVKRAPRWAWFTVAGVGVGAMAIKVWGDRDNEPSQDTNTPVEGATAVGTAAPSGYGPPGIIVPPVIMGSSGDQGSAVAGMSVWADAVGDVVGSFAGVVSQLVGVTGDIALTNTAALQSIAEAGGAPGLATQNPSPIVVNVPQQQAAPSPVSVAINRPAAPRTLTKTCGRSYNGKDGNCRHVTLLYYSNGEIVEQNDHKMHDGPCGTVGLRC